MTKQVGLKLDEALHKRLEKWAEREYSNPAAIARKCVALTLPILEAGVPVSALEAMAGKRGRR